MVDLQNWAHLLDISFGVEASLEGPTLRVRELLTWNVGSVVTTARAAGEDIDIFAGDAHIGAGELAASDGKIVVRMVRVRGKS